MQPLYPYIRVSNVEQSQNYSPDSQLASYDRALTELARIDKPFASAKPFEDMGHSAFKKMIFNRPQFKALKEVLKPGDGIYFAYVDRACRNLRDILNLEHWGECHDVAIYYGDISFTANAEERLIILTSKGLLAQLESMHKSRRLREVFADKKKNNACAQGHPKPMFVHTGRKRKRVSVPNVDEAKEMATAMPLFTGEAELYWGEDKSVLEIRPSTTGKPVSLNRIAEFLERRLCKSVGRPYLSIWADKTLWNKSRVRHAYALFMGLEWAGEDDEKQRIVEGMNREQLIALWPVPNSRRKAG